MFAIKYLDKKDNIKFKHDHLAKKQYMLQWELWVKIIWFPG